MPTKVGVVRRQRMKVVPRGPGKSHYILPLFVLPKHLLWEDEGRFCLLEIASSVNLVVIQLHNVTAVTGQVMILEAARERVVAAKPAC